MKNVEYAIKYVYPDWFTQNDKDEAVGFNKKYQKTNFVVGGKLLIYVTDLQIIAGAYHITGRFSEDKLKPHPLRLPLKRIYCIEGTASGVSMTGIREIVPNFRPDELISYHEITEEQYSALETRLLSASR